MSKDDHNHIEYFDFLRVFGAFAVIILHVSASKWYDTDIMTYAWKIYNLFDSMVRWCVPIFVMMSGALFLNMDITLNKIIHKYIIRLVMVYYFWSFFYAFIEYKRENNLLKFLGNFLLVGHYHLWYIPMIIILYLSIPFLRSILDKGYGKKYLCFNILFAFILSPLIQLVSYISVELGNCLQIVCDNMHFQFFCGYTGYFILGYFLHNDTNAMRQRNKVLLYFLGILSFIMTTWGTYYLSLWQMKPESLLHDYLTINVMLESICIFILFKAIIIKMGKSLKKIFKILAPYSFGVYLMHPFFIEMILNKKRAMDILVMTPVRGILGISFFVLILSIVISMVITKIPFLRKVIS